MAAAGPTKGARAPGRPTAARLLARRDEHRESCEGLVLDHGGWGTNAQHWRGGVFLAQHLRTSPAAAP